MQFMVITQLNDNIHKRYSMQITFGVNEAPHLLRLSGPI